MKILLLTLTVIWIFTSCSNDDKETREFIPGEVSVGIKSGTDISSIFNFINQFEHSIDNINSLSFTSDLPTDNLQYVLDFLNEKSYTNDGVNWFVTGYISNKTITIFPRLFEMNKLEFQNDWLNSMQELELKEKHNVDLNSGIIRFYVPIDSELQWKNQFEKYNIVDWAELNYVAEITPYTN